MNKLLLKEVHITNFRNIVDSGIVHITDNITTLVGDNESGKTNFFWGLYSFNEDYEYTIDDRPNHLIDVGENDVYRVVMVKFQTHNGRLLRGEKYSDNSRKLFDDKDNTELSLNPPKTENINNREEKLAAVSKKMLSILNTLKNKLVEFNTQHPDAKLDIELYDKNVSDFMNYVSNKKYDDIQWKEAKTFLASYSSDESIKTLINENIKLIDQEMKMIPKILSEPQVVSNTEFDIPRFIFHRPKIDGVENKIPVDQLQVLQEGGIFNVLSMLGLTPKKAAEICKNQDPHQRQVYRDYYQGQISGDINIFWTQRSYQVGLIFEPDNLSVVVADDKDSTFKKPSQRSDGFQWFLSFYIALSAETKDDNYSILLLDNPGGELSPSGKRDLLEFFHVKSRDNQILYNTHDHQMIDIHYLDRLYRVIYDDNGSAVYPYYSKVDLSNPEDVYEPLKSVLNDYLVASLTFRSNNILVEGSADKMVIEATMEKYSNTNKFELFVNGSLSENHNLIDLYTRLNVACIAIVDNDAAGRSIAKSISKNIKTLLYPIAGEENKNPNLELEDCIAPEDYNKAVNLVYDNLDEPISDLKKDDQYKDMKMSKVYQSYFSETLSFGFNKRRVFERVAKMIRDDEISKQTQKNLEELASAISKCFQQERTK